MASPNDWPRCDVNQELREAVRGSRWAEVVTAAHSTDCSEEQRQWAVREAAMHAPERFVKEMLQASAVDHLTQVFTSLLTRELWSCVDVMFQCEMSSEQRTWAVGEALTHTTEENFVTYILHHCTERELKQILSHAVSRGQWRTVGKVLERGPSTTLHWWAVEQAMKYASDDEFVHYVLPQCRDEELEQAINHFNRLVSKREWRSVGKMLERGVTASQHRWAVEQASKHANSHNFVNYILPQCQDEDVEHVLHHVVSRRLWTLVGSVLERGGVSTTRRRWAVEQASKHAGDIVFVHHILPQCHVEELEHVLIYLVSRRLWWSVSCVLERGVSTTRHSWTIAEAAEHAHDNSFDQFILRHCREDDLLTVFPLLLTNKKWACIKHILHNTVDNTLYTWKLPSHDRRMLDSLFWKFIGSCHVDVSLALDLTKAVTQKMQCMSYNDSVSAMSLYLASQMSSQSALYESLMVTLLHILCCVMCSDDVEHTNNTEHTKQCVSDIYSRITECIEDNTDCFKHNTVKVIKNKRKWTAVFTEIANTHKAGPLFFLHFLQGLNLYYINRRSENDDTILLVIFTLFPLFPQLQSTALRMMLREKRWDIISQACLSHVWEHDRRQLFKAAVEQRQWDVVRQWADHTVHNDQRDWAMKEAFRENQWKVYLLLADQGLTMQEHMHACYIVAKYGNWDTVLQMVERGGDITEVSNLLETWVLGNLRLKPKGDATVFLKRCEKLIRLRLRFAKNSALYPRKSLKWSLWGSVMFNILHEPTEEYFSQVLHKVIEEQDWHILTHLVRLGMNRAERDWLFPQMVRQQQWGVCRKLLEIGIDFQLCLEALPELMERSQWALVARVMEYSVGDAVRRQMMQHAFQQREGVLFWHCLTTLENQERLSVETRVKLFHQAISRDIWQAVKPLVEEKDDPGIQCRNVAFLEAIEQHLWDVVDYCQLHGADINMEDENGETPLHREARKKEWKAVEEIVFRDGKPNLLDKDGVSVLNRLIEHQQWDTVKFVIKYGANIHLHAKWSEYLDDTHTPLQALIDHRQADVIQFTMIWCPEQRKGVNERGETTLHAVCDSDMWDVMEDLIMRKVDPLAVTKTGQTALVYAVLNTRCPQRMVAECCRLGFSSHQPPLTRDPESLLLDICYAVVQMWKPTYRPSEYFDCRYMRHSVITSPLVCAVLRDLPSVVLMLFESECISHKDLSTLSIQLLKLTDLNTQEGQTLYDEVLQQIKGYPEDTYHWLQRYTRLTHVVEKNSAFMKQLASMPRTLLSSCRLRILRHFHFRDKNRLEYMRGFLLPVSVKNYLEFSDFSDPDYGHHMTLPVPSPQGDEYTMNS